MASTSNNFEAKVLMSKGKRATAAYVHADCAAERYPQHLKEVLDNLLNPIKPIDDWETIDWCKWLMAGGRTPDEFASTGGLPLNYSILCGILASICPGLTLSVAFIKYTESPPNLNKTTDFQLKCGYRLTAGFTGSPS